MRFVLMPFAIIAAALFAMGAQIMTSTVYHRIAWPQTTATVLSSERFFETSRKGVVISNLKMSVKYTAGNTDLTWKGKASDIGVYTAVTGDRIDLHYDPGNPTRLDTAAMKGWRGGLLLLGATGGFAIFYLWFFWLRGGRTPPGARGARSWHLSSAVQPSSRSPHRRTSSGTR